MDSSPRSAALPDDGLPSCAPHLASVFADAFPELAVPWQAAEPICPSVVFLDEELAAELGLDPAWLRSQEGLRLLTGERPALGPGQDPAAARPVAQAYAGHQFGHYSPVLGDGRALLLGEIPATPSTPATPSAFVRETVESPDASVRETVESPDASVRETVESPDALPSLTDLHLKGSGRTPFSRPGSDGLAALGPMLREVLVSACLHALGVPTSRALAVVATGGQVQRDRPLPGAVLARTAASHLRVGTVQYAAALAAQHEAAGSPERADGLHPETLLTRLVQHALDRHHPHAPRTDVPALDLLRAVAHIQAELVAQWMLLGFVHGVMNTDNMTLSGEAIDFGPCAFMEAFDPDTVFSSIDHAGRYAYGNQPAIARWNLTRLAEALLPLIDPDQQRAVAAAERVLDEFRAHHTAAWRRGLAAKLGLPAEPVPDDGPAPAEDTSPNASASTETAAAAFDVTTLTDPLFALLAEHRVDWTSFWASLADVAESADATLLPDPLQDWGADWLAHGPDAALLRRTNPVVIARNHLVEEALAAAEAGDLTPFEDLLSQVRRPFSPRDGRERYAEPAAPSSGRYVTYCGT
ncbi:protein adenylyltransferase SelO family protein [Micrococcus lylae]|uniref:protein adenylyltransferase SelO n=1 Tax=Micrococcus lylae TaxID=1273 RepID=UPI0021A486FB|nr:protein adenylyltransferase SelO family protein [Micrococcus lylae]MCT2006385.1 protein adenylyltransferase SelO family protein [Micrococcus lylae]MCT2071903.1 protein adenylyltransferase SelO family protein [Micrococcus lylae]